MLAGGLSGAMSQWARDRITQLEYAPRLFSRLSSMDQILSDPLSSTAAREYAQSTINALSGEIAALPEQSLPGLQRIVNFSDHFVGGVLGGGIDTVVHLAQGQNVVDSVGSGAMSAGFGYAGGAFGGGACAAFVVTAEAAPLCAMGGAAVGGFIGDKIAPPVIHFVEGLLP